MKDVLLIAGPDSNDIASADVKCTGVNDVTRIQAAIDEAQSLLYPPLIKFEGTFSLKNTLWIGYAFSHTGDPFDPYAADSPAGKAKSALNISCPSGHARFLWDGGPSDNYMVACSHPDLGLGTRFIENLVLGARHNARGLFIGHMTSGSLLDRVKVYQTRGVGIDLVQSWGLCVNRPAIVAGTGYAIRAGDWNGGTCTDLIVNSCKAGDWPTDRPEIPRAAIAVYNSSGGDIQGTQLEGNAYGEFPLIHMKAVCAKGLINLRIEDDVSLHPIVVENSEVCTIERASGLMLAPGSEHLIEFIRGGGNSARQIKAWNVRGSVVSLGTGKGNSASGIVKG